MKARTEAVKGDAPFHPIIQRLDRAILDLIQTFYPPELFAPPADFKLFGLTLTQIKERVDYYDSMHPWDPRKPSR
jgi:hypothetical protein